MRYQNAIIIQFNTMACPCIQNDLCLNTILAFGIGSMYQVGLHGHYNQMFLLHD